MGSETGRGGRQSRKPRKQANDSNIARSSDVYYSSGQVNPVDGRAQDRKVSKDTTDRLAEFDESFDNNRHSSKYYANREATKPKRAVKPRVVVGGEARANTDLADSIVQFKEIKCSGREDLEGLITRIARYVDRGYRVVVTTDEAFHDAVCRILTKAVDDRKLASEHVRKITVEVLTSGVPPVRPLDKLSFAEVDAIDAEESAASSGGVVTEVDVEKLLDDADVGGITPPRMDTAAFDQQLPAIDDEEEEEDEEEDEDEF